MMEIILIVILFKKLKAISDKKNQSKWFPWILPILWFTGEIITPFVVSIVYAILGRTMENNLLLYGYALAGAALGAVIAFKIAHGLPMKSFTCPKCGSEFENTEKIGIRCGSCGTQLQMVKGQLSLIEQA